MPFRMLEWLSESPVVRASDVVIIPAAITLPFWLEYMRQWNEVIAILTPPTALLWLLLQITAKLISLLRK